jgi:hypothetical protein
MMKFAETLMTKHFDKIIADYCAGVFKEEFEHVFNQCCQEKIENDTTLNATYKRISKSAFEFLKKHFEDQYYRLNTKQDKGMEAWQGAIDSMIEEFWYYFDIEQYVENLVFDDFWERHKRLKEMGIIDEEGDYIKKEEPIKNDNPL